MNKAELRRIYLEKRSALTKSELSEASRRIADRFFETFDLSAVKTLHCFISIPKFNEVDTPLIYRRLWAEYPGIRTVAPRVERERGEIVSIAFASDGELTESAWGIREPAGSEPVDAAEIDLVLVPLLCFDESGYRVGYGKGYYDKFLSRCRPDCQKIGLSLFPPIDVISDIHDGDVPLDRFITPAECVKPIK